MGEEYKETEEQKVEEQNLSPQQYFDIVKDKKQHITDEDLKKVYDNCLELLNKYQITGQKKAIRKLLFHLECIEKEREIVKMGIDTFVYRDDIEYYIDNVAADTVKIIDIESYEREIPDDIVELISEVKDKFDQLYIVFTDYTGEMERQVEQERRSKDPILFGVFQDSKSRSVIDRFYYLGDWVDEYCDLTLDKFVNESAEAGKRNIVHTIKTPADIEELKAQLAMLELNRDKELFVVSDKPVKPSFFDKIKSVIKNKKH